MQILNINLVTSVLIGVVFTLTSYVDAKTPDFIKLCKDTSTDCLKESLQASLPGFLRGSPELGIETMDPFQVNNLNLTLPGGLIISFNQGVATGFRKCIIDKARMRKDILDIQLHCNLTIRGKYISTGRLLMFPIDGHGDSLIKCKNIRLDALVKLGSKTQNSEKYLEVKNLKVNHKFQGRVSYQMTNLFKGSPEMSKLVLEFMNRNWKLVAEEFGKPIVDFGVGSIMSSVNQLFRVVPANDLLSGPVNL
ncbi:uncharacterized protein LOC125229503 [Leguminivora glycinivorella]|uniref:uncharacterized protein LOC125229503 n=1 Tax=Leguminivora glycinivorella TaxID=1035111 RepID=UPI00200FA2A5|nr:uncharacterized protein LOC125229503 [Leguminivora glycinivorella]